MNSPHTKLSFFNPDIQDLKASFLTMDSVRRYNHKDLKTKKILIIGLSNTGKSSIALKFLYGFPDAANHGLDENHYTSIKYKNEDFLLHIVDIADIDEYTPIYSSKYSAKVDGYIFVYSIDNRESFDFIQDLRGKLYELNQRNVPSVLIANKSDVKDNRVISVEEGKKLAKTFGMPYLEISAKKHSSQVIRRVFETALKEIVKNEDQSRNLKLLKNWEEEKVEHLYQLFRFASLLVSIIGVFFVIFGVAILLMYSELVQNEAIVLTLIIINGIISITLSFIGILSIQNEEKDWIVIFEALLIIGVILDAIAITLRSLSQIPEGRESQRDVTSPWENFEDLCLLMYIIVFVHAFVLVLLLLFSVVSKEIFIKKRNASRNRFATLSV